MDTVDMKSEVSVDSQDETLNVNINKHGMS